MIKISKLFALLLLAVTSASAATYSPPYPSLVLKNQFGETSINSIVGGSNQIDATFIVDSTNGNGLGVRSVKGNGIAAVYMHTSATPAASNPNPASGYIIVQLASNWLGYVGGYSGFVSPLSGSSINVTSALTPGNPYVITSAGTTTAAGWQSLGLPLGLTPSPGQSFIAITATPTTGTGTVQAPLATGSGTLYTDIVGDPNQSVSATGGAQLLIRVLGATSSSTTTLVATAPANNTVIGMRFVMLPLASQLK
jgi:hypothetical protein